MAAVQESLTTGLEAVKAAPRPTDALRPIMHCPTIKYNRKVRLGREFALDELKHGDASATDLRAVSQGKGPATTVSANAVLPLSNKAAFEEVTLDTVTGTEAAFRTFPMARSYARLVGVRSKRSQAKAAEVQAVKE